MEGTKYKEIVDEVKRQLTACSVEDSKKHYKKSVWLIEKFLTKTCGMDLTMTVIEVSLPTEDICETKGKILTCFYDGGAEMIAVKGEDLVRMMEEEALDGIPPERLMVHFESVKESLSDVKKVCEKAWWVSLAMEEGVGVTADAIVELMKVVKKESGSLPLEQVVVHISWPDTDEENVEKLADTIKKVSRAVAGDWGLVALQDPSPRQLGASYAACVTTDRPDGLFSTVVCAADGVALGLVYSSKESIIAAISSGRGVYYSRSRSSLWRKGDTSGHYQILHRIDLDCDSDALRFTVTQLGQPKPAFCHLSTRTCWGKRDAGLYRLQNTLTHRLHTAPIGSYTKRLFDDDALLKHKLLEEAMELVEADTKQHVAEELADVLYFSFVKAAKFGVTIDDAVKELDKRAKKVTRRKGDCKPQRIQQGNSILSSSKNSKQTNKP